MKWIGCAILFYSVLQFGAQKVEKLRQSTDLLFDVWYAIEEIGRKISISQIPLPAIYMELAKGGQGRTAFFQRLHVTGNFPCAYKEIEGEMFASQALSKDMALFFQRLGKTEADEQVRLCQAIAPKLLKYLEQAQGSFAQKKKMYLSVAACVGGMLVLFML